MLIQKTGIPTVAILAFSFMLFACAAQADGARSQIEIKASNMAETLAISSDDEQHDLSFSPTKYLGQTRLRCGGHDYRIPSYFPFNDTNRLEGVSDNLNLSPSATPCDGSIFEVHLNNGEACTHECYQAGFVSEKNQLLTKDQLLFHLLSNYGKKVNLSGNLTGFYVEPQCVGRCGSAYLAWRHNTDFFILWINRPTSEVVMNELIKSANSYINQGN